MNEAARALLSADHVCTHADADGLGAGALVLRARGEGADAAILLEPGQTPWGPDPDLPPGSVAVLDQGARPLDRTGVIVDHHVPETDAWGPDVIVVTSHGEQPEVPTAPLVRRIIGGEAWLAAVGAFGDLGRPGLELPECAGAPKTAVSRLVPLVNAPRRVAGGPVRTALALLVESDGPKEALADPRIAELKAARDGYRAAFERVVRTRPVFHGDVAVLRFDTPHQVHPLVAQTWSRRVAPRAVLAANDGWIPGRVNFSVRGGEGADLRALLRSAMDSWTGDLGNGHRSATGGSLVPEEFEQLLAGLAR